MRYIITEKQQVTNGKYKYLLFLVLFVILLQQSVLHHSDHIAQIDPPCTVCFSKTDLDAVVKFKLQLSDYDQEISVRKPIIKMLVKDRQAKVYRSRSPPVTA